MTVVQPAQSTADELRAARDRHAARAGPEIDRFLRLLSEAYQEELDRFGETYRSDLVLRPWLDPLVGWTRSYLEWLHWVAWNAANLAPPAGGDPRARAQRTAPALLAYCGLRLVDDGLDRHETFKSQRATLLGVLRDERPGLAADPSAFSAFVGLCVFTFALRRTGEEWGSEVAGDLFRLFDGLAAGALAESLAGDGCDVETYERVARRKASAYNMILYKPILYGVDQELRLQLLAVLSEMDCLAQLVNDADDVSEDRERRQPNAVVQDLYPNGLHAEVERRLDRLWEAACRLPDEFRDALAAMFANLGTERVS